MNKDWMHPRPAQRCVRNVGSIWLLVGLCGAAYGDAPTASPPLHWFVSGQDNVQAKKEYSGELDRTVAYEGSSSGLLKSNSATAQSGTLMQLAAAAPYQGKKIKLKAFLRSRDVAQRAGLWVRADDANGITVAFRNCFSPLARESYVRENSDWKEAEISLDIPITAASLSYGVQMSGTGSVWIDSVTFEVVGTYNPADTKYVPVGEHKPIDPQNPPPPPQNLDFEQ
jgi:hypothetical protein